MSGQTVGGQIDALRKRGAQRFDPVRFGFIEALARRAAAQEGEVAQALAHRLAGLLKDCDERFARARAEAEQACHGLAARFPQAAADLWRLHASGDFSGMHRLAARLEDQHRPAPLAGLLRHIERRAAQPGDAGATPGALAELKAVQQFRSTWTRLGVDRQLARSRAKAPDNPGPLNSHLLVLRSLQQMQETSPAYLQHFMSHVDALLWLDQATTSSSPEPATAGRRDGDKRRKSARGGPAQALRPPAPPRPR